MCLLVFFWTRLAKDCMSPWVAEVISSIYMVRRRQTIVDHISTGLHEGQWGHHYVLISNAFDVCHLMPGFTVLVDTPAPDHVKPCKQVNSSGRLSCNLASWPVVPSHKNFVLSGLNFSRWDNIHCDRCDMQSLMTVTVTSADVGVQCR